MVEPGKMKKNELVAEVKRLNERVTGLEKTKARLKKVEQDLLEAQARHRGLFDNMTSAVAVYQAVDDGRDFVFVDFNPAAEAIESTTREELLGRSLLEAFPGVHEFGLFEVMQRVLKTGRPEHHPITFYQDRKITGWRENYVFRLPSGEIVAVYSDETERKQQEEIIRRQAEEILELSTPMVQVWEGLIMAPLIGTLDSQRTQAFMERFLEAIMETKSSVALLDITGVPTVDTQTAQHVIEAITAARLLGAKVVLTGVRPAIAQTLVHLGIDLTGIETQASLSAGLSLALDMLNLEVVSKKSNHRGKVI